MKILKITASILISLSILSLDAGSKTRSSPGIKIVKTVHGCKKFKETNIDPNRHILSEKDYNTPVIFDIDKLKLLSIPGFFDFEGIEKAPRPKGRYNISRMKVANKYWRWRDKKLVYFNREKNRAGILLDRVRTVKSRRANPPCPCRGQSRYVPDYGRYYCSECRKYVDEKVYLKKVRVQEFAMFDLKSRKNIWHRRFAKFSKGIKSLGVDSEGKYFYFANQVYIYPDKKTAGKIILQRLNLATREIDYRYVFNIRARTKKEVGPRSYHISAIASNDFSKIVFIEYDEAEDRKTFRGNLKNPPVQAYIVDVKSKRVKSINIPVTAYGRAISRDNRYLFLGSNQTGNIHRIDLDTGKQDKKTRSAKSIFKFIISENSSYLYVFTKRAVLAHKLPSLKLAKRIPLNKIIPGVKVLLVSERIYSSMNGKHAAIGILKKAKNGPWYSSDRNDGFYLLKLND